MKNKNLFFRRSTRLLLATMLASACIVAQSAVAQEAIVNGSFESSTNPVHYQQIDNSFDPTRFATGWTTPTGGSPDLLSSRQGACGNKYDTIYDNPDSYYCYPQVCPEENLWGFQPARTGDNMLGFSSYPSTAEYIQTQFSTSNYPNGLAAGQCYHLTFWVSRADLDNFHLKLQAIVSKTHMRDLTTNFVFDYSSEPDAIVMTDPYFKSSKTQWQKVEFDFKALGGEKFLTIGIFDIYGAIDPLNPSLLTMPYQSETAITGSCGSASSSNPCATCTAVPGAYYYIDDVSLVAVAGGGFTPSSGCVFSAVNPNISGTFTGQNILISGDVTISANTIFDNCEVRCNGASTITLPSNKTLHIINNTTIEAGCDNMWGGIIVDGGTLIMRGSQIHDARTAITFNTGTSLWSIYEDGTNRVNTFSRNTVDIVINGSTTPGNDIRSTIFDHTVPLHDANAGNGGYGTNSIVFTGLYAGIPEIIGSTSSSQSCIFLGGENGIVATQSDVTLRNCSFSYESNCAVQFTGMETDKHTLDIEECEFFSTRTHIESRYNTNLIVKECTLSYAQENAIFWTDNHDCQLIVGDASTAADGNVFNDNKWYAIATMSNTTYETDPDALAASGAADRTTIILGNNEVNCLPSSSGFLIAEWQLGQNVSYRELNIVSNTFNDTYFGIQLYNLRGWGTVPLTIAPPAHEVKLNTMNTSTQFAANVAGMKVINSHGFLFNENTVASDNPFNYANQGLYFQNAEASEVYGNTVSAGTAININADMLGSKLHCNLLSDYSTGFYMGNANLCSGITQTHGIPTVEQYSNTVAFAAYPWNADIHVDNSDVAKNQWIWDNAIVDLDVLYTGNTGSGVLFSNLAGPDLCEDGVFPQYPALSGNVYMTFVDTMLQWISDYNYEIRYRNTGIGGVSIAPSITDLIDIEALMAAGEYADALTDLAGYTPTCDAEENYKVVLTILATLGDEQRDATTGEKDSLIDIAELQMLDGGPAVQIARGYLEAKYYLHFAEARPLATQEIEGTANLSAPCNLAPKSNTWLTFVDDKGKDLNIMGCYISSDGSFIFDPLETADAIATDPYTEYRISSKYGSQYNVVTMEYNTLADWLATKPIILDLAGVRTEIDTITDTPLDSIENHVTINAFGDLTYSIGAVKIGDHNQLRITKAGKDGVIWQRTYNGPVAGYDNAATAMFIDGDQNVYVAGKVHNGDNYDIQILKYNTDGDLIWMCMFPDADEVDDIPTGIRVNSGDSSVEIIATCGVNYRYIKVWECLPSVARYAMAADTASLPIGIVQPAFYPNPSNGILSIDLKGNTGGVLELYNTAGQIVYTESIIDNREIILPATIQDGVYLLKFTGEGEPYQQKLVVHRNQ